MAKKYTIVTVVLATFLLLPSAALAGKYDLTLQRMCARDGEGACLWKPDGSRAIPDNKRFEKFAKGFAAVMGPKIHTPAETLGWSGWNLGFEYTLNAISGGDAWDDALQGVERYDGIRGDKDAHAPDTLHTVAFHMRKGLPFSTELGASLIYLIGSKMFTSGIEARCAFIEGIEFVPDMAVAMHYNHLFGTDEMDMNTLAWDFNISYNFGVGGFIQLAPYTGYSLVYSMVAPHVVNPSPNDEYTGGYLLLDEQNVIVNRWFLGLRVIASYVSFIPELIITDAEVYSFSFNLGSEF